MKTKIAALSIVLIFATAITAQSFETDSVSKSEVSKLAFITGQWKGTGWMMGMDKNKMAFEQTENIAFKLDNTVLLIEGQGKSNGKIIHNAMAIVTFNKETNCYNFESYLQNGRKGQYIRGCGSNPN